MDNPQKDAEARITFGQFLRDCREKAEIGLRAFAKQIGVSPAYLSRIESGRDNPPKIETLEKMEKILKLDPGELVIKANKAPSVFAEAMTGSETNQEMLPKFMRIVKSGKLDEQDWDKIIRDAEKRSKNK